MFNTRTLNGQPMFTLYNYREQIEDIVNDTVDAATKQVLGDKKVKHIQSQNDKKLKLQLAYLKREIKGMKKLPKKDRNTIKLNTLTKEYSDLKKYGLKVLILDLDETLIHSEYYEFFDKEDPDDLEDENFIDWNFKIYGYSNSDLYVYKRPHLDEFLEYVFSKYRVVIWTTASRDYAKEVCDNILDGYEYELLDRDYCKQEYTTPTRQYEVPSQYLLKDLDYLKVNIARTIAIDDNELSFNNHKDNHILIKPYFSSVSDDELLKLKNKL